MEFCFNIESELILSFIGSLIALIWTIYQQKQHNIHKQHLGFFKDHLLNENQQKELLKIIKK